MGEKTAKNFVSKISEFKKFLKSANLEYKLEEEPEFKNKEVDEGHELFNKKIIMTGFRNKDLESKLDKIGTNIVTSVSKNTDMVIVKDKNETTGKVEQAKKLNIPIITLDEFMCKY